MPRMYAKLSPVAAHELKNTMPARTHIKSYDRLPYGNNVNFDPKPPKLHQSRKETRLRQPHQFSSINYQKSKLRGGRFWVKCRSCYDGGGVRLGNRAGAVSVPSVRTANAGRADVCLQDVSMVFSPLIYAIT